MAAATLASWVLAADHVATPAELSSINLAIVRATLLGLACWVLYLALEPFARRLLPRRLTSWTRLLSGRLGDPLVGRDLLLGLAVGPAILVLQIGGFALGGQLGWGFPAGLAPLVVANLFSILTVIVPLVVMGIFVVVRAVVRSDRWAPLVLCVVLAPLHFIANGVSLLGLVSVILLVGLTTYAGLLPLVGYAMVNINLNLVPVSLDPSHWWATNSWIGIGAVLALAVWSFRTATRPAARAAGESGPAGRLGPPGTQRA